MSKVKFDFSDVDNFFEQGYAEVKAVEDKVGKEAVDYAVKNGSYQNRTGNLRKSNKYSVEDDGLVIKTLLSMPRTSNLKAMKYQQEQPYMPRDD